MSESDDSKKENLFEILDGAIARLNKTKKLFVIMILSILIIPPIALLITVSVFDNPFGPHEEIIQMRREFNELNSQYRQLFADIEELSPEEKEKRVSEIVNSPEFVSISEKLEKLSQDERITSNHKFVVLFPIKGPQFVIFIISIVWLGIGIRQWVVLSKWTKKYERYKKLQEEVDKKLEDSNQDEK